ncbi:MAG: hypothetical protein J7M26_01730 [Armatimonadetes bacterium]|nr:hypothetical protein [Armatimonadota bacterium]
MPALIVCALLMGVPTQSPAPKLKVIPYGYGKWMATHTGATTHGDYSAVRPGLLFSYGDWKFITLYDLGHKRAGRTNNQLLDAWFLWTPKGKALKRLEFLQGHVPAGWEARTSASWIHTVNRTLVISRLIHSTYDTMLWTEWENPWVDGGIFGVGLFNGTGLNSHDNDDQKDLMVGLRAPVGDVTLELTRYMGHGKSDLHFTEAMAHWQRGDWWINGEWWRGLRGGTHHRGGYILVRKRVHGHWWTSNRWERWTWDDGVCSRGHWNRTTLGVSYEADKCWRGLINYEIYSGDGAPDDQLLAEVQFRWYPWTHKKKK